MYQSIAYLSKSTVSFSKEMLRQLEKYSESKNLEHQITGFLVYKRGRFFQYIEGYHYDISRLMSKIRKDPRHRVIKVLRQEINDRRFGNWGMRIFDTKDISFVYSSDKIEDLLSFPTSNKKQLLSWKDLAWGLIVKVDEHQAA